MPLVAHTQRLHQEQNKTNLETRTGRPASLDNRTCIGRMPPLGEVPLWDTGLAPTLFPSKMRHIGVAPEDADRVAGYLAVTVGKPAGGQLQPDLLKLALVGPRPTEESRRADGQTVVRPSAFECSIRILSRDRGISFSTLNQPGSRAHLHPPGTAAAQESSAVRRAGGSRLLLRI